MNDGTVRTAGRNAKPRADAETRTDQRTRVFQANTPAPPKQVRPRKKRRRRDRCVRPSPTDRSEPISRPARRARDSSNALDRSQFPRRRVGRAFTVPKSVPQYRTTAAIPGPSLRLGTRTRMTAPQPRAAGRRIPQHDFAACWGQSRRPGQPFRSGRGTPDFPTGEELPASGWSGAAWPPDRGPDRDGIFDRIFLHNGGRRDVESRQAADSGSTDRATSSFAARPSLS